MPTNSEHHGPITWLSICSKAAVEWVSKQTGQSNFAQSAAHMAFNLTRRLKLDKFPQNAAVSEPDVETARRYTQAYFEERLDRAFAVVDRSAFQGRLDADFEDGGESDQEDPAWYALRNVVYAYGCRIDLSRRNSSVQAQSQAWKYFENALSVHVNLLYIRTDITAVQALAAMAFFVNSLGCPALEYMLVSNAVLLAYAKGLHLAIPSAWNGDEVEIQKRNHLFWSIYCLEKDICFRSGRPSSIDDEDISCSIPMPTEESPLDLQLLSGSIRHAQVLSRICKNMLTVKGLERSSEETVVAVQELEGQLEAWRQSLPLWMRPGTGIESDDQSEKTHLGQRVDKVHLSHILHLRVAYHGSLSALHSIFFYPWNLLRFGPLEKDPALEKQAQTSTETVAQAARSIILSARQNVVDSSTLRSLGLVFPMVGLINLFIYILKHPAHPGVASDLLLMEIAAGYFSYLEFVLEDHSTFQFAKAFMLYAKAAVKQAGNSGAGNSASYAPVLGELETLIINTYSLHDLAKLVVLS
ncbi:hypothetical protein CDV55_102162 [Aspergillus turcosus]|nr:hypothetical protein CDV55_102162 [Aspergillus turcosus]